MMNMEWKDAYPKSTKPTYDQLLDFMAPPVRALFAVFEAEMRAQFGVYNKYQRYTAAGWTYGYGRSYGCELLSVTIRQDAFVAGGVPVADEEGLHRALAEAKRCYDEGYEERYTAVSTAFKEKQAARTKKRLADEKLQIAEALAEVDPKTCNQFRWSPKVSRRDLVRLYAGEAQGVLDEELLEEIGYTFYARCRQAQDVRAHMDRGEIVCHHCGAILSAGASAPAGSFRLIGNRDALMMCACGQSYTYRAYRASCNTASMPGGRATPIFEQYMQKWQGCHTAQEKMMLVDWLVHEFHVTLMTGAQGRSVCMNLIDGTLKQISELITTLAYGG